MLNLVFGDPAEISEYLIASPIIRKITFTGSTPVGKLLAGMAGQHMKRASMELGGHAPVIVCDDADVALAVRSVGAAKFRNAGQVCISPTRFLVHNRIKQAFSEGLVDLAREIKVGDGLSEGVQMGPLANPRRLAAMAEFHQDAMDKGAKLLTGGRRIGETGNFWEPTVLTDVPLEARLFNDEPFGPVAGVRGFDSLEEAIAEANRLSYGSLATLSRARWPTPISSHAEWRWGCSGSIHRRPPQLSCHSVASRTRASAPKVVRKHWRPISTRAPLSPPTSNEGPPARLLVQANSATIADASESHILSNALLLGI